MGRKKNVEIGEKIDDEAPEVLNVLAPGFAAPDGGWGWIIVAAAGLMNIFCLSVLICFGLIFRDHFQELGINASQTTTLLNINSAVASVVGLANGPLFRKYTYRQVACAGGLVSAISICALSFTETFYGILIFFSILYACGKSVARSASSLALITYFKKKRRTAVGLSWAVSGLGSIVTPQLTTILMSAYDMSGTVLIYGAVALNAVVCAVALQPVGMHAKRITEYEGIKTTAKDHDTDTKSAAINESGKTPLMEKSKKNDNLENLVKKCSRQHFGSQYLYYDDDENGPMGLDVITMGPSMMSRANDGWFSKLNSSRASLTSSKSMQNEYGGPNPTNFSLNPPNRYYSAKNLNRSIFEINEKNRETTNNVIPTWSPTTTIPSKRSREDETSRNKANDDNTDCLLRKPSTMSNRESKDPESTTKPRWLAQAFRKVAIFFDLDLLRDRSFVNLMIGVGFAIFTEINFILLTPYILSENGLSDGKVATVMSLLAGIDVFARAIVSFVATKIGWTNRTFFLVGIGIASLGRIVLAHPSTYGMIILVPIVSGIGKGLTIVFSTLVIPAHVSLEKLPGATGLQLVSMGIIFLILGPIVGWIRDSSGNYTITLHFLNVFSYFVIVTWIVEDLCCGSKRRRSNRDEEPRV